MEPSEKTSDLLPLKQLDWASNRVILSSVNYFLYLSDLKSVRRVSKIWYCAAKSAVARRSRISISVIGDVIQSHVNSFIKQFSLHRSFGFNFRLGSDESLCLGLTDLPVSTVMTELVLHFDATPELTRTVNCLLANLASGFPSLKCLELSFNDNMFQHSGQLISSEPSLEPQKPSHPHKSLETLKIRFGLWGIDWSFLESLTQLQALHVLSLDHGSVNWIKNMQLISSALKARQAPSDLKYLVISTKKHDYKQPWTWETEQSLSSFALTLNCEILVWDVTPEFFIPEYSTRPQPIQTMFWIPFPGKLMVQATIICTKTQKKFHQRHNRKFLFKLSHLIWNRGLRTQQTSLFLRVNIQVQVKGSKCFNSFVQVEKDQAKANLVIRVGKVSKETKIQVQQIFLTLYRDWVELQGRNYTTLRCYYLDVHEEAETNKRFQYECNRIPDEPRESWYQTDFSEAKTDYVSGCSPTWSACQQEASYVLAFSEE